MPISPSPQSVNAGQAQAVPVSFPAKIVVPLVLSFEVQDQEQLSYFQDPAGNAALGFLADLFDYLNFEMQHGCLTINGHSPDDVRKAFQQFIP